MVGFDIVGENAEGNNKTLQMETLAGFVRYDHKNSKSYTFCSFLFRATVMGDVINLGETSFQRLQKYQLLNNKK